MKIFSWMQSKLKKTNTVIAAANNYTGQATSKEEFSDWPQSLLSIGTFGITTTRSDSEESHPHTPTPQQIEDKLISYLETQEDDEDEENEDEEPQSDPVIENKQVHLQRSMSGVFVDQKTNTFIKKKSLTFLLKKMFTSRNKLNHPSLSLPDPTFDKSKMEKILRAILNKKIHPQTSTTKPIANKVLVTKEISMDDDSDDDNEGSMWVKTDSEYIVLEI